MNILIFEWRDIKNPAAGGSEIYFHELAKRWVKKGNRVTIICGGWKGCIKEENIDGIDIIRTGNALTLYLLAPLTYRKLKEKPDVIVDVENGIPFFSPLFSKCKRVLHIHHVHKEVWAKQASFPIALIGRFLETKLMPLFYKKSKIITISKSSAETIEKENIGNKEQILGIVNPGIEFYKIKKMQKSKNPSILFLNRIKRYKGVHILLQAINEINKKKDSKLKNLEVNIAGTGDDLEEMKDFAEKNELKNVKFLGRVSEEKKQELMQKAWIFVNPSFVEGWGIVNIEANYFGTLVIGSNVNGIKDSVINGKTGLLFDYGNYNDLADKITDLVKNKKVLDKMSKYSKKYSKKFDWNKKSEEYLKLLKSF